MKPRAHVIPKRRLSYTFARFSMSLWLPSRAINSHSPILLRPTCYEPLLLQTHALTQRRKLHALRERPPVTKVAGVRFVTRHSTLNRSSAITAAGSLISSRRGYATTSEKSKDSEETRGSKPAHPNPTSPDENSPSVSSTTSSSSSTPSAESTKSHVPSTKSSEEPPKPFLTRAWAKVKHEANHYWDGSKLLVSEVRISARLVRRLLNGKSLTRRERRQLRRTTTDLLRLIPFSVFVIVPFMELLLPVAIKLFPNMLPSTFEDKFAADEKLRRSLRVRLEMAKFLQETLRESGIKGGKSIVGTDEFKAFFYKVRTFQSSV